MSKPKYYGPVEGQKPCPFCGSTWANLYRRQHPLGVAIFSVVCMDCDAVGPWHPNVAGAMERWGWRPSDGTGPLHGGISLCIQALHGSEV